jgi:hypothetical protein
MGRSHNGNLYLAKYLVEIYEPPVALCCTRVVINGLYLHVLPLPFRIFVKKFKPAKEGNYQILIPRFKVMRFKNMLLT